MEGLFNERGSTSFEVPSIFSIAQDNDIKVQEAHLCYGVWAVDLNMNDWGVEYVGDTQCFSAGGDL